jgi:hypothetical protein
MARWGIFMKSKGLIWASTLAIVASQPASAHWQFTKWGMTPEQVIAASHGEASWQTNNGQRELNMKFLSGTFHLNALFVFDQTNHLSQVQVGSDTDVYGILNALKGKYGKPAEGGDQCEHCIWYTDEDRIVATAAGGLYVQIAYFPRTSTGSSGL